jgi:hypothetical protein
MIDISSFGSSVAIISTQSFPMGFSLTQFADDEDPLTVEEVEVSGYEKLYDGNIFIFDKTSPILMSVAVMPNTDDDINMKILMQMRKSSPQLLPLPDTVSAVITYGDGGRVILSNGGVLTGSLADSLSKDGRKKGNLYHFVFGTFAGAQNFTELAAGVASAALGLL